MGLPDFTGWASKNDLKCSDGRTIRKDSFAHQDGMKVPLVWQHLRDNPENVLGYAILRNKPEGVRTEAFFNDSPAGQTAKQLIEHGDINSLSIRANKLVQKGSEVLHGFIQEVSLVLTGANPGAMIDNVNLAHADGSALDDDEAVIFTGETLLHGEEIIDESGEDPNENDGNEDSDPVLLHEDGTAVLDKNESLEDVLHSLSDKQGAVVNYLIGAALENNDGLEQTETITNDDLVHQYKEGFDMGRNLFSSQSSINDGKERERKVLSHSELQTIFSDADRLGSLKESFLQHEQDYGIEDIDYLFPDAKLDQNGISLISRRTEWVNGVLTGTKHSPFSRIKSLAADLTADEARAKGYVKGNLKKDEIIKLLKRVTTPTTVYKKQKLDRDDIVDITDLDVVVWLKAEMRVMLDEEIARAILIGDGRDADDDAKIDEDHLRPIAWDDDMYSAKVNLPTDSTPAQTNEVITRSLAQYKGSGNPDMYTTQSTLTDLLLDKDSLGRRFFANKTELADALGVNSIIPVEVMEDAPDIIAILVNLTDYTIGADKGGEISFFDDFDIDYNQQKYLIETRISGALTKPKSAVVIKRAPGTVVTPTQPSYNSGTHVLTIPGDTGVIYSIDGVDHAAGNVTITETVEVESRPASHYSFPHDADTYWTFVF